MRSVSTSSQITFRSLSASESCRAVALAPVLEPGGGHGESGLGEEEMAHSDGFMSWRLRQKAATCSVLCNDEERRDTKIDDGQIRRESKEEKTSRMMG